MVGMKIDLVMNKVDDEVFAEKDGLTLYKSAYNKLKTLLKQAPGKKLRITLEASGCAGVSYAARLDTPTPADKIINFGDGVEIIVDTTPRFPSETDPTKMYSDWDYLSGLQLKYKEGLLSSSFEMENPNSQRSCACGISFKPKDYGGKPKSCKA